MKKSGGKEKCWLRGRSNSKTPKNFLMENRGKNLGEINNRQCLVRKGRERRREKRRKKRGPVVVPGNIGKRRRWEKIKTPAYRPVCTGLGGKKTPDARDSPETVRHISRSTKEVRPKRAQSKKSTSETTSVPAFNGLTEQNASIRGKP